MTLVDDAQMQGNRLERIVLVAEDQQAQRDQIAGYLRSIGVGVIEARDGAEASTAIIEQRPAVVLMDINMPGLDGIRAAKFCATVTPKPKIVLMSGLRRPDPQCERRTSPGFCGGQQTDPAARPRPIRRFGAGQDLKRPDPEWPAAAWKMVATRPSVIRGWPWLRPTAPGPP